MAKSDVIICSTCGRPVPPKKTKFGRPKLYHRECSVFESHLTKAAELLDIMHFAPPVRRKGSSAMLGHAKEVRSGLNELWKNFTVRSVKSSTADTEFYYEAYGKEAR